MCRYFKLGIGIGWFAFTEYHKLRTVEQTGERTLVKARWLK